jgi:hypothetical protein
MTTGTYFRDRPIRHFKTITKNLSTYATFGFYRTTMTGTLREGTHVSLRPEISAWESPCRESEAGGIPRGTTTVMKASPNQTPRPYIRHLPHEWSCSERLTVTFWRKCQNSYDLHLFPNLLIYKIQLYSASIRVVIHHSGY